MFYNTENFFDSFDDSLKSDDEFTPVGQRHWSYNKYLKKVDNIYKVIASVDIQPPAIIGLCEIENRGVLKQLTENTPLAKAGYQIIHKDSPDPRGIDVAMLYNHLIFKPIQHSFINIKFSFDTLRYTRDILYCKGLIENDTIHLFFNHWPSRMAGQNASEPYRDFVADVLKSKIDSVFSTNSNAKIIVMGDFNDEPDNESITTHLQAHSKFDKNKKKSLFNLSATMLNELNTKGTHKFNGVWSMLDQGMVSSGLISCEQGLYADKKSLEIYNAPFLLIEDKKNAGLSPFRTYNGYNYIGGFSDHLPIILSLKKK